MTCTIYQIGLIHNAMKKHRLSYADKKQTKHNTSQLTDDEMLIEQHRRLTPTQK